MARGPKKGSSKGKGRRARKSAPKRRAMPKRSRAPERASKSAKGTGQARSGAASSRSSSSKTKMAGVTHELRKTRERQAATAEILNIIARSPGDLKSVFDTIVRISLRVVRCDQAFLFLCEGDSYRVAAMAARKGSFDAV